MNTLLLLAPLLVGAWVLKTRQQRQRIALLGHFLGRYRLEKLMETVMDGYQRALGEADAERQRAVLALMRSAECDLADQLGQVAAEFAKVDGQLTRVSRLPVAIAYADRLFPSQTFDMRDLLRLHATGLQRLADAPEDGNPKAHAFAFSAELLLLQHSCHWFCRSKATASARLLGRHQCSHEQVLAAVSADTRLGYGRLIGG